MFREQRTLHFNAGPPEDTYIRGGKVYSIVHINDIAGGGGYGIAIAERLLQVMVVNSQSLLDVARVNCSFGTAVSRN
jgi:hypothetical protein